jgi:homoserine O-acetyltransferase/O-succinyltransferase
MKVPSGSDFPPPRDGITRLSGVRSLARRKRYHFVEGFRIGGDYRIGDPGSYEFGGQGGVTLESLGAGPLRTAYVTAGTAERDESGRITNAVIVSPFYSGDATQCAYYWLDGQRGTDFSLGPVVGPGLLIDTDRYFVVFLDALGLWGASKPSDGLGLRFPRYTIFDCVQANYRLLTDALNIGRVRLATGVSMGAMQSYVWAALHPEFVDAILPIGGSTSTKKDPIVRWNFELMSAAMQSDPVWQQTRGDYYLLPKEQHPNRGMMFGWSILMHTGMDLDYRIDQGWGEVRKEVFSWEPRGNLGALLREKGREYDVNDLLVRNASQDRFDLDDHLGTIRAKALILHVRNDLWLRVRAAEAASQRIPHARFAAFESPLGHYGVFRGPHVLRSEVDAFFRDIGLSDA